MPRPNSKEAILDAAEAIVIESGAAHMTLDAVAERAGLSKGGLMYNFPTKEALIEAMIGRMMVRFDQLREKCRHELAGETPNELMIEIRTLQGKSKNDHRLGAALLAVTATQPELTRSIRKDLRHRFYHDLTTKDDFMRPSILFFAAMGLHFHDLLNLSVLDGKHRKELFEELSRLAGGARTL
jgi:AcrR family transcriptional regulator